LAGARTPRVIGTTFRPEAPCSSPPIPSATRS
jgi:hypothetical protein